ncbi:MAG TPA: class I SAM-dependent methyltransferase [Acidobacteriota bacterium]|nr:class I SAM-dependent methyltransferase [Acidobacteriota bacterium]
MQESNGLAITHCTTTNLRRWNELVAIHAQSKFYDLEGFKAGNTSLRPLEIEEVGDVEGKTLLHLQCHFGMDTLSWARRGAQVTGVDFSDKAIELARSLSAELGLNARFICSNVYDVPAVLNEQFDVVFTSYGVLVWLHDYDRWAQIVAGALKPGGTFYIAEIHPFPYVFDEASTTDAFRLKYPYFWAPEPVECLTEGTYTDRTAEIQETTEYCWIYNLGDIVTALIKVGLHIEFLHEFPFCVYQAFPFMQQSEDGWWRMPDHQTSLPFLFSIRARKP